MHARAIGKTLALALLSAGFTLHAHAGVKITEWMYSGDGGEFIEITNLGATPVDFTGWSYDDDSRTPGVFDLSGFGMVGVGESVVLTEVLAADFMADWNLSAQIKVIGGYTNNLGRADEINLYDNLGNLVDRLTYGDNAAAGGPRTQNASGVAPSLATLGANAAPQWQLSAVGDFEGSYLSANNDIGSPGFTSHAAAVPEPEAYALMLAGLGLVGFMARRRRMSA